MKKTYLTVVLILAATAVCFGEDEYYANRDGGLYEDMYMPNPFKRISMGEPLLMLGSSISGGFADYPYIIKVRTEDGATGWFDADAISVTGSEILPAEITGGSWIHSYYLDVLRSGNRETLFLYEPFWRDRFYEYRYMNSIDGGERLWYEDMAFSAFYFRNICTVIWDLANSYDFINGRITQEDGVFSFPFVCTSKNIAFKETDFEKQIPVNESSTAVLSLDGDFMEISVNGMETFTLIRKTDEIMNQLKSLARNNTADLSRIKWPRRAGGSTDFSPPEGANLAFPAGDEKRGELAAPIRPRDRQSRSQTTDRLRVRENPDTGSAIVTTLDTGTGVQVLETGNLETIGGITAPWVKVLSENGFTGWAFSGYLKSLVLENLNKQSSENVDAFGTAKSALESGLPDSTNASPPNPEQENVEAQNLETENQEQQNLESSFHGLPFAIIGCVVLISGIATIAVLAKRRKWKAGKH